jgi:hypothetical protein
VRNARSSLVHYRRQAVLPFARTLEYFGVLWRRFAVLSMYFGYAYSGLIWEAAKPKKLPAERVVNE